MSSYARSALSGIIIVFIGAYWAFTVFRQHVILGTDFRRDMHYVEHIFAEGARTSEASQNKDIWMRALIFDSDSLQLRGAQPEESLSEMTRRWIHALKLPLWPAIVLVGTGMFLCVPPKRRDAEQGAAANP